MSLVMTQTIDLSNKDYSVIPSRFDTTLLVVTTILLVIGLVMIASASIDIADVRNGNPFHYVIRHGIFVVLGVIAGLMAYQLPSSWWQKMGWLALSLSLLMLIIVLLPGIGKTVNHGIITAKAFSP